MFVRTRDCLLRLHHFNGIGNTRAKTITRRGQRLFCQILKGAPEPRFFAAGWAASQYPKSGGLFLASESKIDSQPPVLYGDNIPQVEPFMSGSHRFPG